MRLCGMDWVADTGDRQQVDTTWIRYSLDIYLLVRVFSDSNLTTCRNLFTYALNMGKLNKRKRTRAKQEREIFTVNAPRREVKQLRKHRQTYLRAEEYRATEDARYLNSNVKAWLAHQYPEDYGYWKRYTEDDRLVSKASDLPICNVRVFPNWGFMPRILPRQGMDRFKGQAIWDWLVSGARRLELEEVILSTDLEVCYSSDY